MSAGLAVRSSRPQSQSTADRPVRRGRLIRPLRHCRHVYLSRDKLARRERRKEGRHRQDDVSAAPAPPIR